MIVGKSLHWLSVSLMLFLAAGCVTTEEGGPNISGIFGQEESNVPLTPAEQQLREDRRIFNKTVLGGAATGAGIGAVVCGLGSLLGGNSKQALRNAAICAAAGGIAGAIDGYRVAKKQEAARQQLREVELITKEVEAENHRIEQSIQNVDVVIADTRRSLREARTGYSNQAVSGEEVRARERRAERNVEQIDELIENIEERNQDYNEIAKALREEGQDTSRIDREIEETRVLLAERKRERDLLAEELEQGRIG